MKNNKYKVLSLAMAVGLASSVATAAVTKDLAYPSGALTSADDIIAQNYFVNHFYSFDNYGCAISMDYWWRHELA